VKTLIDPAIKLGDMPGIVNKSEEVPPAKTVVG
jgi:hypothetical protein